MGCWKQKQHKALLYINEGKTVKATHWKKISSTEVLNHPRIHLVEDTVELPDGTTTTYIRQAAHTTHSVAVIAINNKQEMLLQREYSYPPDQILWQLPGGETLESEDVIVAANRELSEESGFIGTSCRDVGSYYLDNRRSDLRQHVVVCADLKIQPGQRDTEEFIESYWVPIAEVRRMVASSKLDSAPLLAALHVYFASIAD